MQSQPEIIIKQSTWDGGCINCETCGINYNEGTDWYLNEILFYSVSNTGCFSHFETETPFVDSVFAALIQVAPKLHLFQHWHENTNTEQVINDFRSGFAKIAPYDHLAFIRMLMPFLEATFSINVSYVEETIVEEY